MFQDETCLHRMQGCSARHRVLSALPGDGKLGELGAGADVMAARLQATRYLEAAPEKCLSPAGHFFEREIVGSVWAGFPGSADEGLTGTVSIDAYLVEQPFCTVLLTIKGDSMIDAGLMPGDVLIVEKGVPAGVGDIVVAMIDNGFSVKYLEKDSHGFYLNPANPAYPTIRPQSQLEIYGVVAGLFRKYKRRR